MSYVTGAHCLSPDIWPKFKWFWLANIQHACFFVYLQISLYWQSITHEALLRIFPSWILQNTFQQAPTTNVFSHKLLHMALYYVQFPTLCYDTVITSQQSRGSLFCFPITFSMKSGFLMPLKWLCKYLTGLEFCVLCPRNYKTPLSYYPWESSPHVLLENLLHSFLHKCLMFPLEICQSLNRSRVVWDLEYQVCCCCCPAVDSPGHVLNVNLIIIAAVFDYHLFWHW